jgi:hypothetical protein
MAARLGDVLVWASSLIAAFLLSLVAYLVISDRRDERTRREADATTPHRVGVDSQDECLRRLSGLEDEVRLFDRGFSRESRLDP